MNPKLNYFEWGKKVYELLGSPYGEDRSKKMKFIDEIYNPRGFFGKLYVKDITPKEAVKQYKKEIK
jgi:hypothetical protein